MIMHHGRAQMCTDVLNWAWEEERNVPPLPRDGPVPDMLTVDAEDRDKLTGMKMNLPEGKAQNISQDF